MRNKKPLQNPWHLLGTLAFRALLPYFGSLFCWVFGSCSLTFALVTWDVIPTAAFLPVFAISMVLHWFINYRLEEWESRPRPSEPASIENATAPPPTWSARRTPPPPVTELFQLRAAEFFLDRTTPGSLIEAASFAIDHDVVNDSIINLSLATDVDIENHKVPALFNEACKSIAVLPPANRHVAIESLLRHEIRRIADARSTPANGEAKLHRLHNELDLLAWDRNFVGEAFEISSFIANHYERSEYDVQDHINPTPREARFDTLTLSAAHRWLEMHPE